MNIVKRQVLKSLTPNVSCGFSSIASHLAARLSQNPQQNAIRFENQNKTWTFKEFQQHSNAVAYGLLELGYNQGDRVLLWVDKAYTSEITATQVGSAKIGVTLVPLLSSTSQDLQKALKETDCKGVIFSANTKANGQKRSDVLNEVLPELESAYNGAPLSFSNYPNLKHLINVGFHALPGIFKFRQLLVYANPSFSSYTIPTDLSSSVALYYANQGGSYKQYTLKDIADFAENFRSQNNVSAEDVLAVSGSPCCPGTFATGAYQSLAYGNNVVLYGNESFKNIAEKLQVQQPSTLVINQKFGQEDLTSVGNVEGLKRVLTSGDASQYQNVFGGKNVSSFNAYW